MCLIYLFITFILWSVMGALLYLNLFLIISLTVKNCLFLYFCHQMLRLCVQNGREFSIKKGNQNNLFCLNTKKNMCVAQLCNILICHTTPECLPIFRHTISPCTTWFTGHGEILSPFTRVNVLIGPILYPPSMRCRNV